MLRVWWKVNDLSCENPERYFVESTGEAVATINTLAQRDLRNPNVEMNVHGLETFIDEDKEWIEWNDKDGFDIDQVIDGDSEIYDEKGQLR